MNPGRRNETTLPLHSGVCDCCDREDVQVATFADEFGTTLCEECIRACEGQVSYGRE